MQTDRTSIDTLNLLPERGNLFPYQLNVLFNGSVKAFNDVSKCEQHKSILTQ